MDATGRTEHQEMMALRQSGWLVVTDVRQGQLW